MATIMTAEEARLFTERYLLKKYVDDPVWNCFITDFHAYLKLAFRGEGASSSWVDVELHPDATGQHVEDIKRYLVLKGYHLRSLGVTPVTLRIFWENMYQ